MVKACASTYNGDKQQQSRASGVGIPGFGGSGAGGGAGDELFEVIGECVLPLNQLRWKSSFHIWLPLEAPSTALSSSVPAVLKPNYGRLRLKINWTPSSDLVLGDFSRKEIWLLETDLLLANSLTNYKQRKSGHKDASSIAVGNDDALEDVFEELRAYAYLGYERRERLESGTHSASSLPPPRELSDDAVRQLRRLMKEIPTVCHPLCGRLASVDPMGTTSPFVTLYRQVIVDMLIHKEFPQACTALRYMCSDIAVPIGAHNKIMDEVFTAFVQYIHSDHLAGPATDHKHPLYAMVAGDSLDVGRKQDAKELNPVTKELALRYQHTVSMQSLVYSALLADTNQNMNDGSGADEKSAVSHHKRAATISSLSGAGGVSHTGQYLQRYTEIESKFVHSSEYSTDLAVLPTCFTHFNEALKTIDEQERKEQKLLDLLARQSIADKESRFVRLTVVDREKAERKEAIIQNKKTLECAQKWATARDECVVHFWSSYYAYIRYTKQHIFQFPMKRTLALIKAKRWELAECVLRPFSQLRPLILLIAWDLVRWLSLRLTLFCD